MLVGAYAVPDKFATTRQANLPEGGVGDDLHEYVPSEEGSLEPVPREGGFTQPSEFDELWNLPEDPGEDPTAKAVTHRVKGKHPEPPSDPPSDAVVPETSGVAKHHTLFLGIPLRSKHAKEVLPGVQGMINRLEAFGFPVQRYHSDRAKELRSSALLGWLKHQGIHPTSTAGESPAGNRAELAVQGLKGLVKKLLFGSGLPKEFWPLAVLHASARHWVVFNELLGIPQPALVPFGTRILARRRARTGYNAQWEPRVIEARYLGHAPNTPGGHLVLVGSGLDRRVLLTNTIYPLREQAGTIVKPRYRLREKRSPRSPDFSVRVVAARVLPGGFLDRDARLAPGGESFGCGEFSRDFESENFGEGSVSSGELEVPEGSDLVEVEPEGSGVFVASVKEFGEECEEVKCSTLSGDKGMEVSAWIQSLVEGGDFSDGTCLKVLEEGLKGIPLARRAMLKDGGRAMLLGLYGVGGFQGVSKASRESSEVVRYLNEFIREQNPEHVWAALYVSKNTRAPLHKDLRNAKGFEILVRALGEFVGGGLWIADESGAGPVYKILPNGTAWGGRVHDIQVQPAQFCGEKWHVSEPWTGVSRWIISAFTPRDFFKATRDQVEELRDLGFPVDKVWPPVPSNVDPAERPGNLRAASVAADSDKEESAEVSWEVGVPQPIEDKVSREAWVHWHGCVSRLCRLLAGELCDNLQPQLGFESIADQFRAAESLCGWLEAGLSGWLERDGVFVRALQVDVPLSGGETSDQFLQTRSVGLAEARKELNLWKEPAIEEITNLEATNKAVDRVLESEVGKWIEEGISVVQLPGKVVLTRKAGVGKRRCRAVCCGNYLPAEKLGLTREDLYAAGAEAVSVKVALIYAARSPLWSGVTVDVKSAFLYAPIRSEHQGTEERIVVKPPSFLVELGLLKREHRWWIRKALYGLPTSPRDWGRYRDAEFKKVSLLWNGEVYYLMQTHTDEALWVARTSSNGELGPIAGILIVYVDDLAFLGPRELCECFLKVIRDRWKTSEPEWLSENPVTFCGIELVRRPDGFQMSQKAYISELLNRYQIQNGASVPLVKWSEPEAPEEVTVEQVRAAQAITGALLWLSTKTRPDISYVVARCGQQATKNPDLVVSMGKQVLGYLKSTLEVVIDVPFTIGSPFAPHGLLPVPRSDRVIEVYTDASHSPGGERSTQAVFLVWRGVPVAWESSRQAFTTLSSAESELVCMVHGIQLAEALQPLIDELLELDTTIALLGDNEAAIRSFEAAPSGWRNRHLRMRACAGRERIAANLLKVSHLPGEYQVADLGTKPLPRARIMQLLGLVNIRDQIVTPEAAKAARVLSRLPAQGLSKGAVTPEALAGLALLALLPGARGQPNRELRSVVQEWTFGLIAVVVLVGCALVGAWFLGFLGQGEPAAIAENAGEVSCSSGSVSREETPQESLPESSDEFKPEEWASAEAKLREVERVTGLTFLQRVKLKKQIAKGDVVDPPVFQQRYGPLPYWLTGRNRDGEALEVARKDREEGLIRFFAVCGGMLLGFLGTPRPEWARMRACCRRLYNVAVLTLASRIRNAGEEGEMPQDPGVQVEVQFGAAEGSNTMVRAAAGLGVDERGEVSALNTSAVSAEPLQLSGIQDPDRIGVSRSSAMSVERFGGDNPLGSGEGSRHPSPRGSDTELSRPPSPPGSDAELSRPPSPPGSDAELSRSSSQWDSGDGQGRQLDSVSADGAMPGSSSLTGFCGEGILRAVGASANVSREEGPGDGCAFGGAGGAVTERGSSSSRDRFRVGGSRTQVGGSSSSGDPAPTPNVQLGGSSGSHGMAADPLPEGCYEDHCDGPMPTDCFPYVGSWLQIHYVIQLFNQVGEPILWALGERAEEWMILRCVSSGIRCALYLAVAEVLRRGPRAVLYDSPQWMIAVGEFFQRGHFWNEGSAPDADPGPLPGVIVNSGFPYLEGPPGMVAHYLWRLFMMIGWLVLDFLGDRVSSWGYLRAVAPGFRSSATLAVSVWLQRTHHLYIARAQDTFDAAHTYTQGGGIQYPFAVREPEPVLPMLDNPSSESGGSESSTTEPSTVVDSARSSSEIAEASPKPGVEPLGAGMPQPLGSTSGLIGLIGSWIRLVALLGVLMWIVLRGVTGAGAVEVLGSDGVGASEACGFSLQVRPDTGDVEALGWVSPRCDGSSLRALGICLISVCLWEICKVIVRKCLKRPGSRVDASAQTSELNVVPMPLAEGMPSRARILYSFWRAGYMIRADGYSERIQREFEALVGGCLVRNEEGLVSSQSSSDGVLSE